MARRRWRGYEDAVLEGDEGSYVHLLKGKQRLWDEPDRWRLHHRPRDEEESKRRARVKARGIPY